MTVCATLSSHHLTVAAAATVIAMILGTLAAMAATRYEFFGRTTISLLLVLPIALPGIATGIALNSLFTSFLGGLTFFRTLIVGHATFCIVVVFNNAAARLRRVAGNVEEASLDPGASRTQTFRLVTFPALRKALWGGGSTPGVRAVLRRDHRDDIHGRAGHPDPSAVDLPEPLPPAAGAGRQRRRRVPDRSVNRADLPRAPAVGGHRGRRPALIRWHTAGIRGLRQHARPRRTSPGSIEAIRAQGRRALVARAWADLALIDDLDD